MLIIQSSGSLQARSVQGVHSAPAWSDIHIIRLWINCRTIFHRQQYVDHHQYTVKKSNQPLLTHALKGTYIIYQMHVGYYLLLHLKIWTQSLNCPEYIYKYKYEYSILFSRKVRPRDSTVKRKRCRLAVLVYTFFSWTPLGNGPTREEHCFQSLASILIT